MDVSLTPELEDFIAQGMAIGRYKSANEVIQEALRTHIHQSAKHQLDIRLKTSQEQVNIGEVVDAEADFFQRKREMINSQYLGDQPLGDAY